jgi:FkbM family methyltransferase
MSHTNQSGIASGGIGSEMIQSALSENPGLPVVARPSHAHKSFLSRAIGLLGRVTDYRNELGLALGMRWYLAKLMARLGVPGMKRILIKPPDVDHAVTVRMYPCSDDFVFDQLFVQHEYGPICSKMKDARFILDLGANVGYASVIFASRYPGAQILSVEPDPGNYQLCVENIAPYGSRVTPLLGAVWANCGRLALARGTACDAREWAIRVTTAKSDEAANVQAWDIPALLDLAKQKEVDLLKIDIEGSEVEVFAAGTAAWLPRVRNICIELHGDRCREVFFNALRDFDFDLEEYREFTLCLNLRRADRSRSSNNRPRE